MKGLHENLGLFIFCRACNLHATSIYRIKSKSRLKKLSLEKKDLKIEDLLRVILPSWLFDSFDFVELDQSEDRLDIYLEEKKIIPPEYRGQAISSNGFTDYFTVQDFPIRDKEVFLHIRRRKWLLLDSRRIVSHHYDINYEGTKLTKEFVPFLKATN